MSRVVLVALLLSLSSCTNDFGSFSYAGEADSAVGIMGDRPSDASTTELPDADAATPTEPARRDADVENPSVDAAADGSTPPNADAPDAARDSGTVTPDADIPPEQDAGSEPTEETLACRAALDPFEADTSCASCGCDHCAGEVASCLGGPDDAADPLCEAVVACALDNDCRFWGCYCNNPQCARSSPSGDGPCVAEIEAAAGGAKSVVMAKWSSNDLDEPLVRARNLITCTLGLDAQHPQGPVVGHCADACP